MAAHITEIGGR